MNSLGAGVGEFRGEISREDIATLLIAARRNLNEGNPTGALQAVVAALRSIGGEQAATSALRRAREIYENIRTLFPDVYTNVISRRCKGK